MLTIIYIIFMVWIFGKILLYGYKAAWSIFKILTVVVLLPLLLLVMILIGFLYLAIPMLITIGIVAFIVAK